jgi:RNA polymerase sigma-70 factor (ECF subfamily)
MKTADWEAIVKEHGPAVWRVCWRILAHREDVEECFQETFLAAVKVAGAGVVASWPALLHSLATARSVDRLRQRITRRRVLPNEPAGSNGQDSESMIERTESSEAQPAERAVAAELADRLREALTRLPEKQAQAFCLHALDGWPQQQVAAHLGITENAVAVTIHRARQKLKELLRDPVNEHARATGKRPSHNLPEARLAAAPVRAGGVS